VQGIIVFASVMATLGLQILIESGRQLITKVVEITNSLYFFMFCKWWTLFVRF